LLDATHGLVDSLSCEIDDLARSADANLQAQQLCRREGPAGTRLLED
jgi:hypothetical protein